MTDTTCCHNLKNATDTLLVSLRQMFCPHDSLALQDAKMDGRGRLFWRLLYKYIHYRSLVCTLDAFSDDTETWM